jgi:4-hydroxy-tetrahydrodipicolinate synthase
MVLELLRDVPNFAGIKSADLQMFRKLTLNPDVPKDFIMVYSGLDTFDIAYKWGVDKCLDGMCSCTPVNTGKMFKAMEQGDYQTAAECLNKIVALRDAFLGWDLWPAYTTTMNLLGYEGYHCPDYCSPIKPEYVPEIEKMLKEIGEL